MLDNNHPPHSHENTIRACCKDEESAFFTEILMKLLVSRLEGFSIKIDKESNSSVQVCTGTSAVIVLANNPFHYTFDSREYVLSIPAASYSLTVLATRLASQLEDSEFRQQARGAARELLSNSEFLESRKFIRIFIPNF